MNSIKNDIAQCMNCNPNDILDVHNMHAGMTNESYSFKYMNKKLIYRIPGKGSNELVNRAQEYDAYKAIRWLNISDTVIYYDKKTGVKISEYIEHAHVVDGTNVNDITKCMLFAKHCLHEKNKIVQHKINIVSMINKYEALMGTSKYEDYQDVKTRIISSLRYWKKQPHKYCLCHFDLNPDNFLISKNGNIHLLDWEYAGMNDPLFDLAGWIVYKKYTDEQVNHIIDIYLEHHATKLELSKIYAYIAAMGLLWSNWCEYKRKCGEEFGDYAEQQFEYARRYSVK